MDFNDVVENLKDIGFYDIFLPFLLVYVVIFAILQKSEIFHRGDKNDKDVRSVNATIAFVFGLFVVASIQTVKYIQSFITYSIVFVIFILVTLILLSFIFGKDYFKHLFEGKNGKINKNIVWSVAGVILAIAVIVLFEVIGVWEWFEDKLDIRATGDDLTGLIVLVLIIAVLFWITYEKKDDDDKKDDD